MQLIKNKAKFGRALIIIGMTFMCIFGAIAIYGELFM